jgi:hypothetical protein
MYLLDSSRTLIIYCYPVRYICVDLLHFNVSEGLVDNLQSRVSIADERINVFLGAQQRKQFLLVFIAFVACQDLSVEFLLLFLLPAHCCLDLIAYHFELALNYVDFLNSIRFGIQFLLRFLLLSLPLMIATKTHTHGCEGITIIYTLYDSLWQKDVRSRIDLTMSPSINLAWDIYIRVVRKSSMKPS